MQQVQKKPYDKPRLIAIAVKETLGRRPFNEGGGKGKGSSGPHQEAS